MINIEHLAADSILKEPIEITVNGDKMLINKPTVGTLIAASKYIGKIPELPIPETKSEEVEIALGCAGDCEVLGDIVAILFLGRKNITSEVEQEEVIVIPAKKFLGITYKKEREERNVKIVTVDNVKPLAEKILDAYTNKELYDLVSTLLSEQELAFFLNIIISLSRANLLKQKKMTKTTAPGHSS